MAVPPPGGYPNFATKQDLLDLEARLDARFEILEHRLRAHMLRLVLTTNATALALMTGIAFAAARLV